MGDYTVGGSTPSRGPLPTNHTEEASEVKTPEAPKTTTPTDTKVESSDKKPELNKQHGAQMKTERNYSGNVRQKELDQKLAAGKAQIKEFPPEANKTRLDQIHVARYRTEDQMTTQYPNGVKYKRIETNTTHSKDIHETRGDHLKLQKAGSDVAYEVEAPPGGKVSLQKDGSTLISDAKGKTVATVDKDGTLHAHSKEGEYTQSPDGRIRFEQKYKGNLESMRKPGPISPADYENYGITTDGKTMQFPNGVEVSLRKPDPEKQRLGLSPELPVRIPKDLGTIVMEHAGSERPYLTGYSHDGEHLLSGDTNRPIVVTAGGDYHITPDGQVTFEPRK